MGAGHSQRFYATAEL